MTLCLCMIVKDEVHGIVETLLSVAPALDYWVVADTGSTDGTPELVQETLKDIPGELRHRAFVDFATNRNEVFDLANGKADWRFVLSGDSIVHGAEALRAATRKPGVYNSHYIRSVMGNTDYGVLRLTRPGWMYRGVVHEVPVHVDGAEPGPILDGVWVEHHADPRGKRKTWEHHVELLELERRRDPSNARTAFYLAQTYDCLGQHKKALELYSLRASMGGWVEERREALFRAGKCADRLGLTVDAILHYLAAADVAPHRAEPLLAVARVFERKQDWEACYHYANKAARLPYPANDRLFIDRSVYEWRAKDLAAVAALQTGRLDESRKLTAELRS